MNLKDKLTNIARDAQGSARVMAGILTVRKNKTLKDMARALIAKEALILRANKKDLVMAKKKNLSLAFIDRLTLNSKRIKEMADSLLQISRLKDPLGEIIKERKRPNGLRINKVRVPIGVIAIIYESRPNVTSDCIGLCLKSGNSVILRGGSESLETNLVIAKILQAELKKNNIPTTAVNMIATTEHRAVGILLKLNDYIDLVIPRGGEGLIRQVVRSSHIPVIKHYKGICHIYVDEDADLNMAEEVCFNAKVQRPGVCNAMESLLVHKDIAVRFIPGMLKKFFTAGVSIRGCNLTLKIANKSLFLAKRLKTGQRLRFIRKATEKDYYTEYLDLILSVKVVNNLGEAIQHINHYGSHHSDAIITENSRHADQFLKMTDSACVYKNASTRFTDGYQFGMGAEIGISTDKLHARGPMALEELTTYKYLVYGKGQIRR